MRVRIASAPGKAVLSGEYAVLDGAPAISMAVDRRARVRVEATENEFHSVASPGLHERTFTFRGNENGAIQWLNEEPARGDGMLLEHVWKCVCPAPPGGLALTLDTRDFFDRASGLKLGFGSSAALAVALTAALTRLAGNDMQANDLYRTAATAHANFQQGKGSGVDVATAVFGGVIAYSVRDVRPEELQWPAGLEYGLFWSGKPASTTHKLAQLERFARERGAAASRARLAVASSDVYESWHKGASTAVIDSLRVYADALKQFSVDHDLGVFDAGHGELFDEALECGLVYKPCGAGGGDVGIAFGLQQDAIADFAQRVGRYGFDTLDVLPDDRGVLQVH